MRVTREELEAIRQELGRLGASVKAPRQEEKNRLYDFADGRLRATGATLRLRAYGPQSTLTFKGAVQEDPRFKKRPEFETDVGDPAALEKILELVGFEAAFRYDKVREILHWSGLEAGDVEVCLDETPVGRFVEIEGEAAAIEEALYILGWSGRESVRRSYADLYREAGLG